MTIYTIGFAQKSAEEFFGLLMDAKVKTLVDVRLNNRSQLAGFTKARDLSFFLERIGNIGYRHDQFLAPTKALLDGYKKETIGWDDYVKIYHNILCERNVANIVSADMYENACLLCSEPSADRCHRRLAAEYLQKLFTSRSARLIHL